MRVILVGNFLSSSRGTRFYCEDLAERLQAAGAQVIRVSNRENRLLRLIEIVWTLLARRRDYDVATVDVFSGAGFRVAEVALFLLNLLGKPSVAVLHGGMLPEFARRHPLRMRRVLGWATRVVTPSQYVRGELAGFGVEIVWLPNGIDMSLYRHRMRSALKPKLCWIRAFEATYNPLMLINVLEQVRLAYPDATLMVVGPVRNQVLYQEFLAAIRDRGLADAIRIVGPVPKEQVPMMLDQCDIFLNTTHFESFGVAVMEAAASGLPIVSTRVGELPWLWQDGVDAHLVGDGDAVAMAERVCALLAEPASAAAMADRARVNAQQYDWSRIIPRWQSIFASLRLT